METIRLGLIAIWLGFAGSSAFWVPMYNDAAGSGRLLVFIYIGLALFTALGVRERADDVGSAIASTLPNLALLVLAGLAGALQHDGSAGSFDDTPYLYFGVALLASWGALALATAIGARTRWDRFGGLLVGVTVAGLGYVLMIFYGN